MTLYARSGADLLVRRRQRANRRMRGVDRTIGARIGRECISLGVFLAHSFCGAGAGVRPLQSRSTQHLRWERRWPPKNRGPSRGKIACAQSRRTLRGSRGKACSHRSASRTLLLPDSLFRDEAFPERGGLRHSIHRASSREEESRTIYAIWGCKPESQIVPPWGVRNPSRRVFRLFPLSDMVCRTGFRLASGVVLSAKPVRRKATILRQPAPMLALQTRRKNLGFPLGTPVCFSFSPQCPDLE